MSWFRRSPHRTEPVRRQPYRPDNSALTEEIEQNRRRLEQHRQQAQKEAEDGKLH